MGASKLTISGKRPMGESWIGQQSDGFRAYGSKKDSAPPRNQGWRGPRLIRFQNSADRLRRSLLHRQLAWSNRLTRSWAEIVSEVEEKSPSIVGLDIFDTILVRRVLGDEAALWAVARQVVDANLWPGDPGSYLQARAEAVKRAPDAPLISWLIDLENVGLSSAAAALDLEEAAEEELLEVLPGAVDALTKLRRVSPIMFVSDMHLSSETLRGFLETRGLIASAESLVVSCEAGISKSDGDLFAKAFNLADPNPKASRRWPNPIAPVSGGAVFVGNNPWSDVTRAASAGVEPIPAFGANPTRYEEAFAANADSAGPAIAAAARMQRLRASAWSEPDPVAEVAAQVIGQTTMAFLLWVKHRCQAHGIGHLEFLARDGELPLLMAKAMPADHWNNLSLNYLHCSRRAWSLAAVPLIGVQEWVRLGIADHNSFLLHSGTKIPFASLLRRCDLSIQDLPLSNPLRSSDPKQPLADDTIVASYRKLLRSGALNRQILSNAQEPLSLVLNSVRQRGLPAEPIATVDVGWRGHQALLISAIIREATGHEPIHFHFGGDEVSQEIDSKVNIERFALDDSIRPHPIDAPVSCLEMFLASGKRRLVGYRRLPDGSAAEVFDAGPTAVDNHAQRSLWRGAIAMAGEMPTHRELMRWGEPTIPLVEETRQVLELFWNQASAAEAGALSELRFEGDDAGDSIGRIIRSYKPTEVFGRSAIPRQWRHGSLAVTPQPFRSFMKRYFALKSRRQLVQG